MNVLGRIAKSTGILAAATIFSRILGFIRDLLLAELFGTMAAAQAFVVAFRLPNVLRDLVAEGAVTSAFIPVLSWYRTKGKEDDFWRLSQALLVRMIVILCAIGLIGSLAAPQIVRFIAPGFIDDPEKFQLTVLLTRILFPLIIPVGLWAYFMGLLNSMHHFTMPALGPAILNLAMIAACLWVVPMVHTGIIAVAIAVIIGGIIQLAIQLPIAFKLGFRWGWHWHHEGSKEILRLIAPRTAGSAVHQGNVLVHTALASMGAIVGDGAIVALYFANRLVQLPLALFGTTAAQASLPSLSEQAANEDLIGFRTTLMSVLKMMGFVIIPSSIGLIVLAEPIVRGLFERGAFDHRSTLMTAHALAWYSVGLYSYAVSKITTGAFYAMKNTRTPVRIAIEAVVVNIIFSLALMKPMAISGLALSASISNMLNAYRLLRGLEKKIDKPLLRPLMKPLLKVLTVSIFMGLSCTFLWSLYLAQQPIIIGLPLVILFGIVFYFVACRLVRIEESEKTSQWLKNLPLVRRFKNN